MYDCKKSAKAYVVGMLFALYVKGYGGLSLLILELTM